MANREERPVSKPILDEPFSKYSMRDIFYVFFRHKWKMILFFLAVVIIVTAWTFLSKEIYRSEAKLMVRIGRESVTLDPTVTTGQVMSMGSQSREYEINSELEILKSRELAQRVVDTIGPNTILEGPQGEISQGNLEPGQEKLQELLDRLKKIGAILKNSLLSLGIGKPLADREKAIIEFTKKFTVDAQKNTNILLLSYEAPSKNLSRDILEKLINFFLEKHIVTHRTVGTYDFFNKESSQLRNHVAKVEEELTKLKTKTGVASLGEHRRILMDRVGSLQRENETTQAALVISRAKIKELKGKLDGLSPTVVTTEMRGSGNYAADLMRARLYDLQLREQDLLSKYTENNQLVQEVRRQIEEAQALLAKEEPSRTQVTTGINTAYETLNLELIKEVANLSSLEAKAKVVKAQQEEARLELNDFNNTEEKMVGLQRELSLMEAKYRKYSENVEQARIDQALLNNKISNISIVQAPTTLPEPVQPKKALNVIVGFFVGILGGIILAFFSEYLDHSLKRPRDIEEKLNLPILASLPIIKK
jgi:uncharacterized protein involved in exopolysaccharide biosynthesis